MNYRANPQTIFRVIDDKVIALNLGTGQYYTMNEVGTRVWVLLEQEASNANIIEAIESDFEGPVEQITEDLAAFLEDLQDCGLIEEV